MNILFITENFSSENYGVTTVLSQLSEEIAHLYLNNHMIIASTGTKNISPPNKVLLENISPLMNNAWRWSPILCNKLTDIIAQYRPDLIHVHGMWMAIQWTALSIAKNRDIPCIISPHGMLEQWFWNTQGVFKQLKKNLYLTFLIKKELTSKTFFHAITQQEVESVQKYFPSNKTKIIPNAIKMLSMTNKGDDKTQSIRKKITFLGRLHPIKGVHILIEAFAKSLADKEWQLLIAGPEENPQYVSNLKRTVHHLGIEEAVQFIGTVWGSDKWSLLRESWVVVVPSFSEVVGMVNLEAAMSRVPSITTYETGLLDWESSGGLIVHPTVNDLSDAISKVKNWSIAERIERGCKAYDYVQEHYSWQSVLPLWKEFYAEVTNGVK